MAQIILNSAAVILIATAFLSTAVAALRSEDGALQRVPVRARNQRRPKS